jgi:alpha-beta hydrolase superfamily lysophospholipase
MLWYIVAGLLAIAALWLVGDLAYALVMRAWYARWESTIQRDSDGVRAGCREGDYGRGATAVLLIHGFGDSPAAWVRMAPALADRGLAVRTIRLPGHALPMTQYRRTRAPQWRTAVQEALSDLRRGHGRVVAVAHSMGAAALLDALAERADLADGMALLAPLIDVAARRSPVVHPRTWFRILDTLLVFTDRIWLLFPPDLHDAAARPLMREDVFMPRVVFRELFGALQRNRNRAKMFTTPLLMVLGKPDLVIDNAAAERYFADYGGPKRLLIAANSGHMLPIDYDWEMIVEETAKFAAAR